MQFRLVDVDLGAPLPDVRLTAEEAGMGIVLRRDDHVVGFSIHPLDPGVAITPAALAGLLDPHPAAPRPERRSERTVYASPWPSARAIGPSCSTTAWG